MTGAAVAEGCRMNSPEVTPSVIARKRPPERAPFTGSSLKECAVRRG